MCCLLEANQAFAWDKHWFEWKITQMGYKTYMFPFIDRGVSTK